MKVGLIGYGKMGQAIEQILLDRGHTVVCKLGRGSSADAFSDLKSADVVIEFSVPGAVIDNIKKCLDVQVPIVTGTTGWNDQLNEMKTLCNEKNGAIFYASNFSIGMNLMMDLNKRLAKLMNNQTSYEVSMEEIHHVHKLDSPSGTAITLAEGVFEHMDRKSSWTEGEATDNQLKINAKREGEVPGTHIMTYENEIDLIEIKHVAKSRQGFALGAVVAAEWLVGKQGMFTMTDMLK